MTRLLIEADGRYEVTVMIVVIMIFSILPLSQNTSSASVTGGAGASFVGVWKGDSVCQIKDSPCHDEVSVYYVSKGAEPNSFQMKMNKVVDSKEETMGTVNCRPGSDNGFYVCRLNELATWTCGLMKMCSTETWSTAASSIARFT